MAASNPVPRRLRPGLRNVLWALPLLLSILFVSAVVAWAEHQDRDDAEAARRTTIADGLSLEAQLRSRLETETARLKTLAASLPVNVSDGGPLLAAQPELIAGLDRLWLSVTWLDEHNRVLAQQRRKPEPSASRAGSDPNEDLGLTLHLVAAVGPQAGPTPSAAHLIARYAPADLLKSRAFWWLAAKYDVELVTGFDQVIASTADSRRPALGESHALDFTPIPDTRLRLTPRQAPERWYRTFPLVLMSGFLLLIAVTTALLRSHVVQLSRAEAAWRTEAAWRGAMEDSALVGLRARDASGRLLYANRTFRELVGYPAEALIGCAPPMPYWPAESIEETMLRSQRSLQGNAPREGYEARWRHASGRMLDVMVFESALVDAHGVQIGWMGSIVDITERKRLAELERKQTDALAHHARLTTLGEVASTLAHELNQPLSAIVSYNAGLMTALAKQPALDRQLLQASENLGKHAAQAGRIVHRIRERLSRREPVLEACDLNQILREAVDLLKHDLQRTQVRVSWQLAAQLPDVRADRVGVEQIVINLVRNALDALAPRAGERRLTLSSACDGACVQVSVSDNGPGLAGQTLETLIAPFYSNKPDGMGMGLAICRSILDAHRGALAVADADSGGACFSFKLPTRAGTESRA